MEMRIRQTRGYERRVKNTKKLNFEEKSRRWKLDC